MNIGSIVNGDTLEYWGIVRLGLAALTLDMGQGAPTMMMQTSELLTELKEKRETVQKEADALGAAIMALQVIEGGTGSKQVEVRSNGDTVGEQDTARKAEISRRISVGMKKVWRQRREHQKGSDLKKAS